TVGATVWLLVSASTVWCRRWEGVSMMDVSLANILLSATSSMDFSEQPDTPESHILTLTFYQNKKNYVFINQAMSWSSAQQYCRKNYKDLAMIENQEENTEAQNAKPSSDVVWIGLYREPWTWSDGSNSSFRNWNDSYLNNYADKQHCGIENSDHNWDDLNCVSHLKTCVK
uniref:C-type lectin domain-containing protein n=1 Tax=Oryzias latipes TaxID=8090 RepID=H2MPA1_ORYLA